MIGQRNAWIAARARNAARKGFWIAVIGGVAVVAMLIALVWVPREQDRQLHRRIAELPKVADSMPIVRRLDSLRAQQRMPVNVPRRVQPRDTIVTGDSSSREIARVAEGDSTSVTRAALTPDSAAIDLMARLTRARSAPLPDSYRALAESPLMNSDPRVKALVDSIDLVDREREAHAALGGPGARYAALTARLTALGQRIVRLAEQRLSSAVLSSISGAPSTNAAAPDSGSETIIDPEVERLRQVARDSTRGALQSRIANEESSLIVARQRFLQNDAERARLTQRLQADVPPFAMVVAALVVGVAFGYAVVLVHELRKPTVGDASEVERLAAAPVLRHTRETATVRVRGTRGDRRGIPRIIDRESDTFVLLHLALTAVGDVVETVAVLAADPAIAAAVALGTAAAATRESRAVLVVDDPSRSPVLARLLRATSREALARDRAGTTRTDDAMHVITLDRDAHFDVCLVRSAEGDTEQRAELDARYDLRLYLSATDDGTTSNARDVILCVRQGATPLAWLSRATLEARRRDQRVRAVVLWSRDVPAGS